ncbi:MAG: hypothetical protein KDE47_11120 [Caldilineaceae bacterium]|nr:hypothetical protein [Caldilineaceae bacterium]
MQTITLSLPESTFLRFEQMSKVTHRPLVELVLRAVEVGSPPGWEEAPARFQTDLAALDRLDNQSLWQIAKANRGETEAARLQELLDRRSDSTISAPEEQELSVLVEEADRFMLCKAHAAALLRWRGEIIPPAEQL